jgi:hypothetical protein
MATVLQLKKKLDKVFSEYIRRSNSNFGLAMCVTCGVEKPWKELQNGHYISRGNSVLRYDERNCHVQCAGCNVFKNGNYPKYALFMIDRYGVGILKQLETEAKEIKRWKVPELEAMIADYRLKLDDLTD